MSTTDEIHDKLFCRGTDVPRLSVDARSSVGEGGRTEAVLSSTEVVDQHFVPRGYLKRFEEAERHIWVTSVDGSHRNLRRSRSVATRPHGYRVTAGSGVNLSVEDWLARRVETPGFPVLHRLIADPGAITRLAAEGEQALARFVAALMVRVPKRHVDAQAVAHEVVGNIKEFHRNSIKKKLGEETGAEWFRHWDVEPDHVWLGATEPLDFPTFAAEALSQISGWANVLLSMPWACGASRLSLFTSDNPVSRFAGRRPPSADPYGWPDFEDFHYYLALSPSCLLVIGPWPDDVNEVQAQIERGQIQGPRTAHSFSPWESAFARRVIAADANQELYGKEANITKEEAVLDLGRLAPVMRRY